MSQSRPWFFPLVAALGLVASSLAHPVPAAGHGAGADRFGILSCSLGCTSSGPNQLSCTIQSVHVNQEVRVRFSQPLQLASVNNASFQVVELATGKTPPGLFRVDPEDPCVLVYQPVLIFDSAGNPIFGLKSGATYLLKIPGARLDPLGPWITSVHGMPVENRLLCTLVASLGIEDPVPGPPTAQVSVEAIRVHDRRLDRQITGSVPANGATAVVVGTDVTLDFDDVMNPGTLVNPVLGTSSTILVGRAPDPTAQPIAGSFNLVIDPFRKTTRVVFRPAQALPAGEVILVDLLPSIADLAGNALTNPGVRSFTTVSPAPLRRSRPRWRRSR